jgi:transposase
VVITELTKTQSEMAVLLEPLARGHARGIAQMMRAGLYRPVHVKTLRSQKLRMLLTHRKLLQSKAIAVGEILAETIDFDRVARATTALPASARGRSL